MVSKDFRRNVRAAVEIKIVAVVATASVVVVAPVTFSLIANTVMYGTLPASIVAVALSVSGVLLAATAATESYRRGLSAPAGRSLDDMKVALLAEFGEIERATIANSSVSVEECPYERPCGIKRWTVGDIAAFYRVRRMRNNIVGGGAQGIEDSSLEEALAATRHLRSKL